MRGARVLSACAVLLVAGVTGCVPEGPAPTPSPTASPTPTYVSTYQTPSPTDLAPLTGVVVPAGSLTAPSLAAKIDNHPAARPQVALERADLVFEELVEGGLTRYVGVWHSDVPPDIGPVRSIRPMDPDIISPLGGIVAYSGGQQRFVQAMQNAPVYNAIHGQADTDDTFYRTNTKRSPHNVLVRAPQVIAQHLDLTAPPQQFAYSLDAASSTAGKDGVGTRAVNLVFGAAGSPAWTWDLAQGRWLRFMTGGAPDLDSAGAQLAATNLVVLRVAVTVSQGIPKTELIGSGEAWVATAGAVVHATWTKTSPTDRIRLLDDNGVVVRLAPGNSWIELVPLAGSVDLPRADAP